ncbi:hypothetical protein [uncultured Bacteroides sp.]|uniref:hypothetical protein n=1 Tax=uncultured Bacteroides sp. TaxID=162156 RepID=UPI00263814A9|nr:hypothetical protein [uncultured Bacteroides sp.]
MKHLIFSILITFLCFIISCCSDDKLLNEQKTITDLSTKATISEADWMNWHDITLASNDTVEAPWCTEHTVTGAIPFEIRTDVLPENGWELIYYSVNEHKNEKGVNYIIFHNIFTGVLKVFYYNETKTANSNVMWNIGFTSPQKLLYASDKLSLPLSTSLKSTNALSGQYTNSLTDNASKGISVGWNCFQIQLTYDPEFTNNTLTCYAEGINNYSINLDGELEGKISGLLLSNVKKETPYTQIGETFAKLAGNKAGEWLSEYFGETRISTYDINSIITSGVTKFLSSFIGRFNKQDQSKQYIELTTDQQLTINGELTSSPISGYVTDVQIPLNQNEIGFLGNWGLTSPIVVYISPMAIYTPWHSGPDNEVPYQLEGNYRVSSANIAINPKIKDKISDYTVNTKLYMIDWSKHAPNIEYANIEYGTAGSKYSGLSSDLGESLGYGFYTPTFKPKFDLYIDDETKPQRVSILDYNLVSGFKSFNNLLYIAKVTVTFHTNINGIENTIITTRSFIPQLEWD